MKACKSTSQWERRATSLTLSPSLSLSLYIDVTPIVSQQCRKPANPAKMYWNKKQWPQMQQGRLGHFFLLAKTYKHAQRASGHFVGAQIDQQTSIDAWCHRFRFGISCFCLLLLSGYWVSISFFAKFFLQILNENGLSFLKCFQVSPISSKCSNLECKKNVLRRRN